MTSAANLRGVFKGGEQVFGTEPHVLLMEAASSADTHLLVHPPVRTHPAFSLWLTLLLQPAGGAGGFCRRPVPAQTPSGGGVGDDSSELQLWDGGDQVPTHLWSRCEVGSCLPEQQGKPARGLHLGLEKETGTRFALRVIIPQAIQHIG